MDIISEILKFENEGRVFEYRMKYKNIPIWPYARGMIFEILFNKYENHISCERAPKKMSISDRDFRYNTFKMGKKEILLFGMANALVENNGTVYDRHYKELEEILSIEYGKIINCAFSNYVDLKEIVDKKVVSSSFIEELISHEAKMIANDTDEEERLELFIEYIKEELPLKIEQGSLETIRKRVRMLYKSFPFYYKYYGELIKKVNPKLVIFICGSYGLPYVRVFNDNGIVTAELQHCTIRNHYHYSSSLLDLHDRELIMSYPNYFLTWGDFWGEYNGVMNKVVIGNPKVELAYENMKDILPFEKSFLMIMGNTHERYIEFIDGILQKITNARIVLKFHPSCMESIKRYEKYFENMQVVIKRNEDLYDCFSECKYVIGEASTALYEAIAIGKEVFIIDTEDARNTMMHDMGKWIKDVDEMLMKLEDPIDSILEYEHTDWQNNFQKFVNSVTK